MRTLRLRPRRTRGMTLIEAVISTAVFSVVSILSMLAMQTTGQTAAMVSGAYDAQMEAEVLLSRVRSQLQGTGVGPGGLARIDPNPANNEFEVQYRPVDPAKPTFDWANSNFDANPWAGPPLVGAGPYWGSGQLRVIKFEPMPGENFNDGLDNDGDGRVDEGQVRLYNRTYPGAVDSGMQPLGTEVSDFDIAVNPVGNPFGRITVRVQMQRPLPSNDASRPMVAHDGNLVILLTN